MPCFPAFFARGIVMGKILAENGPIARTIGRLRSPFSGEAFHAVTPHHPDRGPRALPLVSPPPRAHAARKSGAGENRSLRYRAADLARSPRPAATAPRR